MQGEELDRHLKIGWKMLLKLARGDEERATEAFPWLWKLLSRPGTDLSWKVVRRALWSAARSTFPQGQTDRRSRYNALDGAQRLFQCQRSRPTEMRPPQAAIVHEAMALVDRAIHTQLEWVIVRSRLLGFTHTRKVGAKGAGVDRCQSTWRRLQMRCRRLYPSLVGAF